MKVLNLLLCCLLLTTACNNNTTTEPEEEEKIRFERPLPPSDTVNAFHTITLQNKTVSL